MAHKLTIIITILLLALSRVESSSSTQNGNQNRNQPSDVESAVLAAQAVPESQQEESYQRVYEAFTRLMQNVSNNSLGNMRRLVSRLNQLVGGQPNQPAGSQEAVIAGGASKPAEQAKRDLTVDERTEQLLSRLDGVNKETDQHSLRQLNEDINKLVGTLSESYLRNLRRVIERVNKVVGQPAIELPAKPSAAKPAAALHQSGAYLGDDPNNKVPGFPGWDELIVAMDRMQKSLAQVVRSSTRLITGTG